MKNQCKQEFADSDDEGLEEFELSFVNARPTIPLDTRIGSFPPGQRALHADKLLNVFEVSEQGNRASVIVLAKSSNVDKSLTRQQRWFEQHGKHAASQLKQISYQIEGTSYVVSHAQLLGRVAINTPGRLRDVNDEWLSAALERLQTYQEAATEMGFHLPLAPSVISTQVLFGEYYLSPFALLDSDWASSQPELLQDLCSTSTLVKTLYWLISGINLFDEDSETSLLSMWAPNISTRHAEALRAAIDAQSKDASLSHLLGELTNGKQSRPGGVREKAPAVGVRPSNNQDTAGLSSVAGRQSIKQTLLRLAMTYKQRDANSGASQLNNPAFSVFLFGPSGCGKTYIAKRLAEELGVMLLRVRPSDITSMFVRESVTRLRGFFDEAIKNRPCVLFFDEIDFLVPDRNRLLPGQEFKVEEINELLIGLQLAREEGVFIIAATNQPFHMDHSIFQAGRFDKIIYVEPPEESDRTELLQSFLQDSAVVPGFDPSLMANQLDGFSAADLQAVCSAAVEVSTALGRCPISIPILSQALNSVKPSISAATEQRFAKFIAKGYEE